jgi:hypothetical protein
MPAFPAKFSWAMSLETLEILGEGFKTLSN